MSFKHIQRFLVEVNNSWELIELYLRMAMETVLCSTEEIAIKAVSQFDKDYSLYLPGTIDREKDFPVILLGGFYAPEEGRENSFFNGYKPWDIFRSSGTIKSVDIAIQHIKNILNEKGEEWSTLFRSKFGHGYNAGFNHMDGTVELGFQIRSLNCFPEQLAISLMHIYIGK